MSRTSRALIAGGAALALLAGSGATFARWYDEKPLADASVTTGTLRLLPGDEADVWKVAHSNDGSTNLAEYDPSEIIAMKEPEAKAIADPASFQMVPGDYVVLKRTVKLNLVGDNLRAQFGVTGETEGSHFEGISTQVQANCEGKSGNSHLTEADNNKTCTVYVGFQYPFGPGDNKDEAGAGLDNDHSKDGWHGPEEGMNKSISVAGAKLVLEQESTTAPRP